MSRFVVATAYPRPKWAEAIPYATFAAVMLGFLSTSSYARFDFPLDDAWIHRVYAQAIAWGRGFEYNVGVQEAGSTSPLWAVVTAPAHWLESLGPRTVVLGVKAIGALLCFAAVGCVKRVGRELTGSPAAGIVAACAFALEPRLAFSALSGMETPLVVALWLGIVLACVRRQWCIAAGLTGLAIVTRPEMSLALPAAIAAVAVSEDTWRRRFVSMSWFGLALAPAALWMAFCLLVTGHPLPNTYYVKGQGFSPTTDSFLKGLLIVAAYGKVAFTLVPGLVAATLVAARNRRPRAQVRCAALLMGIAPGFYIAAVVATRALELRGYYWERWFEPASLVLMAGLALSVGAALVPRTVLGGPATRDGRGDLRHQQSRSMTGLVVVATALIATSPVEWRFLTDRSAQLSSDSRAIHLLNVRAGEWVAANTALDARVGVNDAGAIRYFGKRRTIDLIGLNDAAIASGRQVRAAELDWLVVFPHLYQGTQLARHFAAKAVFEIPEVEYTNCRCPGQNRIEVMARRPE